MASIPFLSRLFPSRVKEAAAPKLSGSPMVRYSVPYNYVERSISPELIAADRSVPVVLSALVGLNRLCFGGFDHSLKPIDEGDDTQGNKIEAALKQIKLLEKKIGRVGKARKVGTLGLIRAAALDGWSFRQALAEYSTVQEGNWLNFQEIQHLPAQSFARASTSLFGDNFLQDKILPGIVYDSKQDLTRFFQSKGTAGSTPTEVNPEQVLYIEDSTVPDDVSFLKALVPIIEQWKEVRRYGMTAERRVAVPNETVFFDGRDIAALVTSKIPVKMQELIDYAKDLVQNQSYANEKVALPGMKLQYPAISMPLNPWEADAYLKKEITDFFFKRDVLEVTAQAISATNAPAKDLLDLHIASERELWGKPYEGLWNSWLEWNGFDLVDEFAFWEWTPVDQAADHKKNLELWRSHVITLNEMRLREGLPALKDDEKENEIQKMADEIKLIWGAGGQGANALNPSMTTP